MIDLKPYGAFVENTIRPLLNELRDMNFPMSEDILLIALKDSCKTHIITTFITVIRDITVVSIIAWGIWKTSLF